MKTIGRRFLGVAAVAALSAVPLAWLAGWAAEQTLGLSGLSRSLAEARPRRRDLDDAIRRAAVRVRAKEAVVTELLAGRVTLLQAAARFRAIDRAMPEGFWARFGRTRPDDSDHEYYCRQVIGYVTPTTDDDRSWELVLRLEAELREHLKNGTLRLPQTRSPIRVGLISPVEAK